MGSFFDLSSSLIIYNTSFRFTSIIFFPFYFIVSSVFSFNFLGEEFEKIKEWCHYGIKYIQFRKYEVKGAI